MNGFWTLGPKLWTLMRARPRTSAALGLAACALALGIVSCRSTPSITRTTPGVTESKATGEPEVRIRIRSNIQTARLEGPRAFLLKRSGSAQTQEVDAPLSIG